MSRNILLKIIYIFLIIAVLSVAYVVFDLMGPAKNVINKAEFVVKLSSLVKGEVLEVNTGIGPILILKPSQDQLSDLDYLDGHVWNPQYSGFNKEHSIFIQRGIGTIRGCKLDHYKKGKLEYTIENGIWLGGYFGLCYDSSYDYAGRTIKTWKHSINGGIFEAPNLLVPNYIINKREIIIKLL
jgi:Rieske Fe-S protein